MESFSSNHSHGLTTSRAVQGNSLVAFVVLSLAVHASLFIWKTSSDGVMPSVYMQAQTVSGLHLQIKGSPEAIVQEESPPEKTAVVTQPAYTLRPLLPSNVDMQNAWMPKSSTLPESKTLASTMEPVKGLAVGSGAFASLGGSRKKAFSFINPEATNRSGSAGSDPDSASGIQQVIRAMVRDLGDDLNRQFPTDVEQSCRLQNPAVCERLDTDLEKFLSIRAPMFHQLLGVAPVKVSVEQGRWQVVLSP
jgi:hypothetical protein